MRKWKQVVDQNKILEEDALREAESWRKPYTWHPVFLKSARRPSVANKEGRDEPAGKA